MLMVIKNVFSKHGQHNKCRHCIIFDSLVNKLLLYNLFLFSAVNAFIFQYSIAFGTRHWHVQIHIIC